MSGTEVPTATSVSPIMTEGMPMVAPIVSTQDTYSKINNRLSNGNKNNKKNSKIALMQQ